MQVIESLWLSRYIKILENNKKTPEEIIKLKKEFIEYFEGTKKFNLSNELTEFLSFLSINNEDDKIQKRR